MMRLPALLGLILNGVAWGIAWFFPRNEATAILHYSSSIGIDFVGEGRHIMVLPALGMLILVLNLLVGRSIRARDGEAALVLATAVPLVQMLLILALLFLRSVNNS